MTDEDATLRALVKWLVRQLIEHQVDITALRMALKEKGLLSDFDVERYRAHLLKTAQPSLDELEDIGPDKLLDMLRRFEGPLQ